MRVPRLRRPDRLSLPGAVASGYFLAAMKIRTPLRVLHVESGHEWRATRDQVRLLVEAFIEVPGIRQAVATLEGSRLAVEVANLGIPVISLPWSTASDPRTLRTLARVADTGWDVLHAHDAQALRILLYISALEGSTSPIVASRRISGPPDSIWKWRRASVVLAVSETGRQNLIAAGVEPGRVVVVPNGINMRELMVQRPGHIRELVGAADQHLLVGSFAALEPDRDHVTLLRAAAIAIARQPEVRFAVLGDGSERSKLEGLIERLGLAGKVCLPGYVPDARHSMCDFDVFVLPAKTGEMASSALEALAAGVPLVMPHAIDHRFRDEDGIAAAQAGDPQAFADAILGLLGDPERRKKVGEAARSLAEAHGLAGMVNGTLRAYEAVVHG
ncbi:MAG: glycosyltransferase [Gemmatimonadota bacterium]